MKSGQLFLILAIYATLTGCGQPGALYLPGQVPPGTVEPTQKLDQKNNLN